MHYTLRQTHRRRWVWLVVPVMLLAVLLVSLLVWQPWSNAEVKAPAAKSVSVATEPATKSTLKSDVLFVGDVFWGRSVQRKAEASAYGIDYLLHGIKPAYRAQYDAWVANFECPVTNRDIPYSAQVDSLQFNCQPKYLNALKKWFTAASLANNHTANNQGSWGLDQTRTNLQQAGIQHFGTYDMDDVDDICEVVTLPAHSTTAQKLQLPVALCGYMYVVDVRPTDAQLAVMAKFAKVMPVIAMPHMGVEYRSVAETPKVDAYRQMIDNGADVVVGAHPHVIQNSEAYKGRLIAYSVGNFLFDQQTVSRATTVGLGVKLGFTIADQAAVSAYQSVASDCKQYKDSCVATLSKKLSHRPAIAVNYDMVCFDESSAKGNVPVLVNDATCRAAKRTASADVLSDLTKTWPATP